MFAPVEILSPEHPHFRQAMQIYEEEIPSELRQDEEVFARLLRSCGSDLMKDNLFHLFLLKFKEEGAGFISFNYLKDISGGFISYVATSRKYQRRGCGKNLIELVKSALYKDAEQFRLRKPGGVFTEIERVADAPDETERRIRAMRARFFRTSGFLAVRNIDYVQPAMLPGQSEVRLNLLFLPLDFSGPNFDSEELKTGVRSIYRNVYQLENAIDMDVIERCIERATRSIDMNLFYMSQEAE